MANDNNRWISCDDELPLASKRVLITTIYGNVVEASRVMGSKFNRLGQEVIATH